ncbi:ABC transporter permease [Silvibacterium sp.]|uniref:ABC transporter permease n=1 Tax=Silvibacterium sp. TaxID=1964179 RepID=UPI0039E6861A
MDLLFRDLRQTLRNLASTPGFSLTVVLVMALGIGATAALFTVVNSVLMKPLPLPDSDRLVRAWEASPSHGYMHTNAAPGIYKLWHDQNRSFESLAIATPDEHSLASSGGQLPERIETRVATWQALPTLGVQPAYGRLFTANDDRQGAPETAMLTWSLWKRRFGGDPSIVGRQILLDTVPFTVIGILPEWFSWPNPRVQLWMALGPEVSAQEMASLNAHSFMVIGKLRAGVSVAAANADLTRISANASRQFPGDSVMESANVKPLLDAETYRVRTLLNVLFAATACLLLIACLNIANLLVARSAARRRELAIRSALGSSRARLIRDRLLESLVLCSAGGLFGILIAQFALQWLVARRTNLPRVEDIHLDAAAVAFAVLVAIFCGLIAGLAPAVAERHDQLLNALQDQSRAVSGSRQSLRFRRAVLTVEVALTVVLLVGAGLFLRDYQKLRSIDIGVPTANTLTMNIELPFIPYKDGNKKIAFYEQLQEQVRALPGVHGIALATVLPGQTTGEDDDISIAELPPPPKNEWQDVEVRFVDPGFFRTLEIPLRRGRVFTTQDRLDRSRLVIVNESFVKTYLRGQEPLGKHVNDLNNAPEGNKDPKNEIVGVVGDVRTTPDREIEPTIYFPLYNGIRGEMNIAVRTAENPLSFALPIQRIVAHLDPTLPVADILTYDDVVGKNTADASFNATLLTVFAGLSLVLAAVGLFGVLSFLVAQRTPEIGVRMALGAQREHVLRLLLADGLRPAILGLVLGIVASAGLTRLVASLLYGTQPLDPLVFGLVSVALLTVAALACLLPAWRASQLDPVAALRAE